LEPLKQNENTRTVFSFRKCFTKIFIRTDKISEIVKDSDSDGGSFSELFDSDMCKVSSLYGGSSIEEEGVVQPELDRGTKRKPRTLPNRANTDFELGWKEKIQAFQKPALSGVSGINKNFQTTQCSFALDIFEITSAQKCSNIYTRKQTYIKQQLNKNDHEGSLLP